MVSITVWLKLLQATKESEKFIYTFYCTYLACTIFNSLGLMHSYCILNISVTVNRYVSEPISGLIQIIVVPLYLPGREYQQIL